MTTAEMDSLKSRKHAHNLHERAEYLLGVVDGARVGETDTRADQRHPGAPLELKTGRNAAPARPHTLIIRPHMEKIMPKMFMYSGIASSAG